MQLIPKALTDGSFATEFEEFIIFCSDNVCCPPMEDHMLNDVACTCAGCKNCGASGDYVAKDFRRRNSNNNNSDIIVKGKNPEALCKNEMTMVPPDLPHHGSCDSSISSKGSFSSGLEPNHVRVSFDTRLAAATAASNAANQPPPLATIHTIMAGSKKDVVDTTRSEATEKSTRFNDALNTTIEYTPNYYRQKHDDDEDNEDGIKSEGGEVRWRTSSTTTTKSNNPTCMVLRPFDEQQRFDQRVLGTSTKDESAKPHVLSTLIMDEIQQYLPYSKRGEFFWLKYSLIKDGACIRTLLHKTRTSDNTILGVETTDGEIFGAFLGNPWRNTRAYSYYGSPASFLWRVRQNRQTASCHPSDGTRESDHLEVFRYGGQNRYIQLCSSHRLALGGGSPYGSIVNEDLSYVKLHEWGFGLAFEDDLQYGTSSPCITFESPALSTIHRDGSKFEVANLEIWTLTPATSVSRAEMILEGKSLIGKSMTM